MLCRAPIIGLLLLGCASPVEPEPEVDPWRDVLTEYARYYPYKAIAFSDEGAYGYAHGVRSAELAVSWALESCEEHSQAEPSGCAIWALGHRIVADISDVALEEEIRLYSTRVFGTHDLDETVDDPARRVPRLEDYFEPEPAP